MKSVGIIGNFGGNEIGGQIVKTRELYEAMRVQFDKVNKLDVYDIKKNTIQLVIGLFYLFRKSSDILIILASPGYFKILPVIFAINCLYRRNLYEIVIGGVRDQYIKKKKNRVRYERSLKRIYVESNCMVEQYETLGLYNAFYLPNFKKIQMISEEEMRKEFHIDGMLRFCTFSRIDRLKGIDDAVHIINVINSRYGRRIATLDIIGPIDEEYEEKFFQILNDTGGNEIKYLGKIESSKAVEVLKRYDALLFPTKWLTEGFPGTFIDAMAAGLPILATERNNFKDIIQNGYNGYLISDTEKEEGYIDKIYKWYQDRQNLLDMKRNALKEAQRYTSDNVLAQIWKDMR